MREQFIIEIKEDNNLNRPYIEIYNGLLDSPLFDGYDKMLLICIMSYSAGEKNSVNIATVSIKNLCKRSKISKPAIYRHIKKLEESGVLIKSNNSTIENGNMSNTYKILNYISVWNCKTMEELKKETDKIKTEVLTND